MPVVRVIQHKIPVTIHVSWRKSRLKIVYKTIQLNFIKSCIEHSYNPDTVGDKHNKTPCASRSNFKQVSLGKSLKKKNQHG